MPTSQSSGSRFALSESLVQVRTSPPFFFVCVIYIHPNPSHHARSKTYSMVVVASFFNTTQVVKRAVARRGGDFQPMSEALAQRMIQICNAELVAISVIPITATLMARGVLYSESIPWQVEAGLAAAVFAGLSYKYLKEAFTWED